MSPLVITHRDSYKYGFKTFPFQHVTVIVFGNRNMWRCSQTRCRSHLLTIVVFFFIDLGLQDLCLSNLSTERSYSTVGEAFWSPVHSVRSDSTQLTSVGPVAVSHAPYPIFQGAGVPACLKFPGTLYMCADGIGLRQTATKFCIVIKLYWRKIQCLSAHWGIVFHNSRLGKSCLKHGDEHSEKFFL